MANARFVKGATYVYTNSGHPAWFGTKIRAVSRVRGTESFRFTLLTAPKGLGYTVGDEVGFPAYNVKLLSGYSDWVKRMGL